jgi:hypothetical protein
VTLVCRASWPTSCPTTQSSEAALQANSVHSIIHHGISVLQLLLRHQDVQHKAAAGRVLQSLSSSC